MNKALLSSVKMDYCTPQAFFNRLNEEFHFALDAAATAKSAKCPLYYTPETDGLSQSWNCGGAVFCNPPYGREIGKWVRKAFEEAQAGATVVMLIPARTDTSYFTTTSTARRKSAFCVDACISRTRTGPIPASTFSVDGGYLQQTGGRA